MQRVRMRLAAYRRNDEGNGIGFFWWVGHCVDLYRFWLASGSVDGFVNFMGHHGRHHCYSLVKEFRERAEEDNSSQGRE